MSQPRVCLILHNLRSAHNVGAIFRTADAAGVEKVYLTGYTPRPVDQFGRASKEIAKTALGAEQTVPWEYAKSFTPVAKKLKPARRQGGANNFTLVALEQARNSVDYKKIKIAGSTAVVVGSEVDGLTLAILKQCDVVAEIPMRGLKESLNVSVAVGICLFRLLDI